MTRGDVAVDRRPYCSTGCGRVARFEGQVLGVGWGPLEDAVVVELVCWRHGWKQAVGRVVARLRRFV